MGSPKVSVLIPAYNQAQFLGDAIQSVLDQTYSDFELIIVNDASTDNTNQVIEQFPDPRIRCITHEQNRGLSAARNTGIRAASGDLVALLDSDDYYHPEKLRVHIDFLEKHPEIEATCNARYDLIHSSKTIRDLWRPPLRISLSNLVLGFPYAPSDLVIRRDWLYRVGLYNETLTFFGEDLDMNCRLALSGCQFASVDRILNYRRYHSGRKIKNIDLGLKTIVSVLDNTFADPFCPDEVTALRNKAISKHKMLWSIIAFDQDETSLGQKFLTEAIQLNPSIIEGDPSALTESIISYSISEDVRNHEHVLRRIFDQLPSDAAWDGQEYGWALAHGYLLKGTRAIQWGRIADGRNYFNLAASLGARIDEPYLQRLSVRLMDYEALLGSEAVQNFVLALAPYIKQVGNESGLRLMRGHYLVNQAFHNYNTGQYDKVPARLLAAITNCPNYLTNRGLWAILVRSIGHNFRKYPPNFEKI
jgi:glycosyltransferase involved in cell wall biosynthesis